VKAVYSAGQFQFSCYWDLCGVWKEVMLVLEKMSTLQFDMSEHSNVLCTFP